MNVKDSLLLVAGRLEWARADVRDTEFNSAIHRCIDALELLMGVTAAMADALASGRALEVLGVEVRGE